MNDATPSIRRLRLIAALTLAAFLTGCAGNPEARALRAREDQARSRPAVLATAVAAEMPEGRGAPGPPPPPRTPVILPPAESPSVRTAAAPTPDGGDEVSRFFLELLAVGAAASLAAAAGGNECPAD